MRLSPSYHSVIASHFYELVILREIPTVVWEMKLNFAQSKKKVNYLCYCFRGLLTVCLRYWP